MDGGRGPVQGGAQIGPNAILQTAGVLDHYEGRKVRDLVMDAAGVLLPPPDSGMVAEEDCAAVHRAVRQVLPDRADDLLRLSGLATGDYILRHRIPRLVQVLLRLMPAALAARVLTRAITQHAWTFAGSGAFRVVGWRPLTFEVRHNPLIAGEKADHPMCHWHAAVFERLFQRLVWPSVVVAEVACEAAGGSACVFQILPC
ncbi:MAG: bacteriochlorophyll 4-vinyl reductase, partial [Paracoccaceae bacterium]